MTANNLHTSPRAASWLFTQAVAYELSKRAGRSALADLVRDEVNRMESRHAHPGLRLVG